MTTKEFAKLSGMSIYTLNAWARKNGVSRKAVEGKAVYGFDWTKSDIEKFNSRNKKVGKPTKKFCVVDAEGGIIGQCTTLEDAQDLKEDLSKTSPDKKFEVIQN